jgi:hypothetical protein
MRNTLFLALACIAAVVGLAASGNQGPGVNRVMREKLDRTQKILEAVVTSDWVGLESETRELERLTDDPRWTVLNFPEYARHSADFKRTIADLHKAAAQRDLENTPKAYIAVTLSCISCHRYLARARIAEPDMR